LESDDDADLETCIAYGSDGETKGVDPFNGSASSFV